MKKQLKKLNISKENALKAYAEGCDSAKSVLENLFGKELFLRKTHGPVKTFKDACQALGIKTFKDAYKVLKLKRTLLGKTSIASCEDSYLKLMIICKSLNEGWVPNWADSNEYKYYPYFEWNKNKSGFVFSLTSYDFSNSGTIVGSRLCFKTRELAEYAGKQFESLYAELINP